METKISESPQNIVNRIPFDVIDWASFIAKCDLDWADVKYSGEYFENNPNLPKLDWGNSPFIGNGMIGAVIYKDSKQDLKWELGRNDVEAHNFIKGVDWCVPRVPIGDIILSPIGQIKSENIHLSLWNAETTGDIITNKGTISWRSFVHASNDVLIIELITTGNECECVLKFNSVHGVSPRLAHVDYTGEYYLPPYPYTVESEGVNVSIQTFVNDDGNNEGECAVAWQERIIHPNKRMLFLSISNTYMDSNARYIATKAVKDVLWSDFNTFEREHRDWWHKYYPQSFISLPDSFWQTFYWRQMYKLAAATRSEMDEVLDDQGPWLAKTSWPGTWWNLNVQLSYCPLYKANRLNIAGSLVEGLNNKIEALRKNSAMLGIDDGIYVGRTSGRSLFDHLTIYDDMLKEDSDNLDFELGNLTYALHNIWRQYKSTMDTEFLMKKLFPLLRANINVFLHLIKKDHSGKWHLPKTTSPEYPGPKSGTSFPAVDTNYDIALLRWGCMALLEADKILNIGDALSDKWHDVLDNLVDYPCDENGFMVASEVPFSESHRHYSHLFAFYPLHIINTDNKKDFELAERSFEHWINKSEKLQGYSYTGGACMAATLGNGNLAIELLERFKPFVLPNTMYMENGGAVIETPISATESIHYMLMQCWGDTIRVFPAVPKGWDDVSFGRLLAEGGFEVSAIRNGGQNLTVVVKSLAGLPLKISPNLLGEVKAVGEREFRLEQVCEGVYTLDLKKGEQVTLYSENKFR